MRLIIGGLDPPLGVCATRVTQCTSFCWNDSLGSPRCTALPCVLSCPDKNTRFHKEVLIMNLGRFLDH